VIVKLREDGQYVCRLDDTGLISASCQWQQIFLFSKKSPDQLWRPPSLLFSGHLGLSPWEKSQHCM